MKKLLLLPGEHNIRYSYKQWKGIISDDSEKSLYNKMKLGWIFLIQIKLDYAAQNSINVKITEEELEAALTSMGGGEITAF